MNVKAIPMSDLLTKCDDIYTTVIIIAQRSKQIIDDRVMPIEETEDVEDSMQLIEPEIIIDDLEKPMVQALGEYLKGPDFKEINDTISVQTAWENIVGKAISKNTKIETFKNGTIIVKVSTPIWRNELSLQKQSLLEKLKKTEQNLNVKKIILK